jgi:hypothetical protein
MCCVYFWKRLVTSPMKARWINSEFMIQLTYELFGAIFSPMLGGVCIDVSVGIARLNQISDFKSENKELQAVEGCKRLLLSSTRAGSDGASNFITKSIVKLTNRRIHNAITNASRIMQPVFCVKADE